MEAIGNLIWYQKASDACVDARSHRSASRVRARVQHYVYVTIAIGLLDVGEQYIWDVLRVRRCYD